MSPGRWAACTCCDEPCTHCGVDGLGLFHRGQVAAVGNDLQRGSRLTRPECRRWLIVLRSVLLALIGESSTCARMRERGLEVCAAPATVACLPFGHRAPCCPSLDMLRHSPCPFHLSRPRSLTALLHCAWTALSTQGWIIRPLDVSKHWAGNWRLSAIRSDASCEGLRCRRSWMNIVRHWSAAVRWWSVCHAWGFLHSIRRL